VTSVLSGVTFLSGTLVAMTAVSSTIRVPQLLALTAGSFDSCNVVGAFTVGSSGVTIANNSDVTFTAGSSVASGEDHKVLSNSISRWNSVGAAGVLTLGLNSTLDATQALGAFVVESVLAASGSGIDDPYLRITKPVTLTPDACAISSVRLNLGPVTSVDIN
jgi:hypothetical protein